MYGERQWPSVKIFSVKYLKSQYPSKFPPLKILLYTVCTFYIHFCQIINMLTWRVFAETVTNDVCAIRLCQQLSWFNVTKKLLTKFKTRSEQDLNLRGETPLDFKSNALTTRPSLHMCGSVQYHMIYIRLCCTSSICTNEVVNWSLKYYTWENFGK